MAVTFKVDYELAGQAGAHVIGGTLLMDGSYATGGEAMNLATHLHNSSTPTVVISAADGYMLEHDCGTANAGKVVARYSNGNALNGASFLIPLVEVAGSTNLYNINTTFIAIGKGALE